MSSRDDLQVWASTIDIDPITSTPQREPILADIWQYGWLRETPVTAQDINQLMYTVTDVVKNDTLSKAANLNDVVDKASARTNLDLLQKSQNFADVPNKATARANLELDTVLFNQFFDKIYPVGTVYENKTNSANPNTYLGRGTWVAEGQGRVSVGAGSGTDTNGTVQAFTAGTTGGEYSHELTSTEMPAHTHPYRDRYYIELAGSVSTAPNKETTPVGYNLGLGSSGTDGSNDTWLYYDSDTTSTGGGLKHNNIQPYVSYFRWLRTA